MARKMLDEQGHPVLVLRAQGPLFDKDYFHRMMDTVSPEESSALFHALRKQGFITCKTDEEVVEGEEGGHCDLSSEPRRSKPLETLLAAPPPASSSSSTTFPVELEWVAKSQPQVEELLNVVWNYHEITSEKTAVWFDFVVSRGRKKKEGG